MKNISSICLQISFFKAKENPQNARKKWIASHRKKEKYIIIDKGAEKALKSGKSLLPAGVTNCSMSFKRGETVEIISTTKNIIGCGIIAYDSNEVSQIGLPMGREYARF